MKQMIVFAALSLSCCAAQTGFSYGTVTLMGSLAQRNEAGYEQYTVLLTDQPVCTIAESAFTSAESGLREIQSFNVGQGPAGDAIRDRLSRLPGQRVTIRGQLMHASTGYHKTTVLLDVQQVEPLTAAGRQVLLAPRAEVRA